MQGKGLLANHGKPGAVQACQVGWKEKFRRMSLIAELYECIIYIGRLHATQRRARHVGHTIVQNKVGTLIKRPDEVAAIATRFVSRVRLNQGVPEVPGGQNIDCPA